MFTPSHTERSSRLENERERSECESERKQGDLQPKIQQTPKGPGAEPGGQITLADSPKPMTGSKVSSALSFMLLFLPFVQSSRQQRNTFDTFCTAHTTLHENSTTNYPVPYGTRVTTIETN